MDDGTRRPRAAVASEAVVSAMACLAPWAFGAVDARAELGLGLGILLLAVLGLLTGRLAFRPRNLACLPSLALGGLALLALWQAIPLSNGAVKVLAPATSSLRGGLAPPEPQRVVGDEGHPVAPPSPTLSLDPEASTHAAVQLASAWILFQAVLGLGGGVAALRRLGLALAVNGALLALFSIAQALSWGGKIYGIRPTPIANGWYTGGPFVCHNHLAAYLNLGLGFALAMLMTAGRPGSGGGGSRGRGPRRAWGRALAPAYLAGLIVAGVLVSHSRGGFVAMATATVATLLVMRPASRRAWGAIAGLAALATLLLAAVGSDSPLQRLGTIWDSASTGFNGRSAVWAASLRAWRAGPILGAGLGSFPAATAPYFDRDLGVFFTHAEDEYLQLLVEGGLLGLGLALAAIVGIAILGRRALVRAETTADRATVAGVVFGGVALAVQSIGDFPLHIPAIAVAATALFAHLCRLGLDARDAGQAPGPERLRGRLARVLAGTAVVALALGLLRYELDQARAEALVASADLPAPGSALPTGEAGNRTREELERMRVALEGAVRLRPDWAEGHLRLGLVRLGLYQREAEDWLRPTVEDERTLAALTDPVWLHGVAHSGAADPAGHEPVRKYLVPAARSFLEARRSCPSWSMSHARLAILDYLVEGGEPAAVHAGRALRQAGADGRTLDLAARAAAHAGDLGLAARCWSRAIEVGVPDALWSEIADAAAAALPVEGVLEVFASSGRDTLRYAIRVDERTEDEALRDRFLRAAIERLPRDRGLTPAERAWSEGLARAYLDEREPARKLMGRAVALESSKPEWREEFVNWLILWGDPREAHRQAKIGLAREPSHPASRRAAKAAVGALAVGVNDRGDREGDAQNSPVSASGEPASSGGIR